MGSAVGRTAQLRWQVVDMGVEVAAGAQVSGPLLQSLKPGFNVGPSPASCKPDCTATAGLDLEILPAYNGQLQGVGNSLIWLA